MLENISKLYFFIILLAATGILVRNILSIEMKGFGMLRLFAMLIFSALFLTACTGSAYKLPVVTDADMQATQKKMSENKSELKIYKRTDKGNIKALADASRRLTKNIKPLCEYAEYKNCHFQVVYAPDDTVNAYASEGYKITVHRGLLQYLKNNDEIAAVVAHEMGHHLANHNEEKTQNATTGAAVSGIVTALLLGAANANNPYYNSYQQTQDRQTIESMMNAGAEIGAISYSKEQEKEADLLATYILSRSGYNLKQAQNIMLVLANFSGEAGTSRAAFLDTHPAGMERFVAWDKAIDEVKKNPTKLPYPAEKSK